jgi:DNA-directed RNA polymerase specialized sigma24 family protein
MKYRRFILSSFTFVYLLLVFYCFFYYIMSQVSLIKLMTKNTLSENTKKGLIMNIGSSMNLQSIMSSMQGTQRPQGGQRHEPPLKEQVDAMSAEDREEFDSKIESLSHSQRHALKSLMEENSEEISSMSTEDATAAILSLVDEAAQTESTDDSFANMMEQEGSMPPPPPKGGHHGGGHQGPPPLANEVQNMTEEEQEEFQTSLDSLSDEQKFAFMELMKDNEEEISSMETEDATDAIFALLEEASSLSSDEILDTFGEMLSQESIPPPPPRMSSDELPGYDPENNTIDMYV